MADAIQVVGLKQFTKALKDMDKELPKTLRLVNNAVANIVVEGAAPEIPSRSGRARRSLKARSTRTAVRIAAGGKRVPYYGWLDFGGSTGINRSVHRPFYKEGRYIYPTYTASRDRVTDEMIAGYTQLARDAGLEVS